MSLDEEENSHLLEFPYGRQQYILHLFKLETLL